MEFHGIKRRKENERRNLKDHWVWIPMYQLKIQHVNWTSHSICRIFLISFAVDSEDANALEAHVSTIKRDVHKFIFDDEAVVVDDCSFVLPYIEGAFYYQSTTPPPATDAPLPTTDVDADDYTIPLVPAYTEQQLKELLRRQV